MNVLLDGRQKRAMFALIIMMLIGGGDGSGIGKGK